jgi:hypothetical protein
MLRNRSRCLQLRGATKADVEIGLNRGLHARGSSFKLDRVLAIAFSPILKRRQMRLR